MIIGRISRGGQPKPAGISLGIAFPYECASQEVPGIPAMTPVPGVPMAPFPGPDALRAATHTRMGQPRTILTLILGALGAAHRVS